MASNAAVSGLGILKKIRRFLSKRRTRTYIFPTGFGFAFGAMLLVLFVLAVGYSNNLLYIFVFFLASVAWTATLLTNRNVEGLEVENFALSPLFCEEEGFITIAISNSRKAEAWNVEAYFDKSEMKTPAEVIEQMSAEDLQVFFRPAKRGLVALPKLIIQSKFPVSFLRAWKVFKKTPEVLVYPSRKGERAFPAVALASDEMNNVGLFREHRAFQSTDPALRVDWRASARRQELLVKTYEGGEKRRLAFDWDQTKHLPDIEARVSQLCLWIDEAERQGHEYSLRVEAFSSGLHHGPEHHHSCLEVLALIPSVGPR